MPHNVIRFLLNGEPRTLADPPATRTVLDYLRLDEGLTGTKEGCAEGDCGACTVVLAEANDSGDTGDTGAPRCRAVNACIQFLPTLDGKAIFTVESLGRPDKLHPVQQAMVEQHGSQCGFCTPGFVMSLFALYKTLPSPTRAQVEDALSGNLCRCTGYRPIIDAAQQMLTLGRQLPEDTLDWLNSPAGSVATSARTASTALQEQLHGLRRDTSLAGAHPEGAFHAPRTIAELAALRARLPEARLLAGGTDVGLWVTKQLRDLGDVIYLGRVAALDEIRVGVAHIEIGASATLSDAGEVLAAHYPGLADVLRRFASPPIRNAATLGGNIANGSPIGDSMPCLIALGARIVLHSLQGTRDVALEDFYLDYQKTALRPDEFVERILVPRPASNSRFHAYKISKRFDQDIAIALGAFQVTVDEGRIGECRLAFGGMAAIPKRAAACEAALRGAPWTMASIAGAAEKLGEDFSPLDDLRGSAAYRLRVAKNLLYRFFIETATTSPPASSGALRELDPVSL